MARERLKRLDRAERRRPKKKINQCRKNRRHKSKKEKTGCSLIFHPWAHPWAPFSEPSQRPVRAAHGSPLISAAQRGGEKAPKRVNFGVKTQANISQNGRSGDNRFAACVRRPRRRCFQATTVTAAACSIQERGPIGREPLGKGESWEKDGQKSIQFCRPSSCSFFRSLLFLPTTVPRPLVAGIAGSDRRRRGHVGRGPGAGRGRVPARRIRHESQGLSFFLSYCLSISFSSLLLSHAPLLSILPQIHTPTTI